MFIHEAKLFKYRDCEQQFFGLLFWVFFGGVFFFFEIITFLKSKIAYLSPIRLNTAYELYNFSNANNFVLILKPFQGEVRHLKRAKNNIIHCRFVNCVKLKKSKKKKDFLF